MVRLAVGVVLAAVLQFVWGFVFWMILPLSKQMFEKLPDEDKVTEVLKQANLQTGVYHLPDGREVMETEGPEKEAFLERHRKGPLAQIIYIKEGMDPMGPTYFALGFGHMLATSLVAGLLLLMAGPGLNGYCARTLFVVGLGAFAVLTVEIANPIWMGHPWKFHLLHSVYYLGSWVLTALTLAAFVRRPAV